MLRYKLLLQRELLQEEEKMEEESVGLENGYNTKHLYNKLKRLEIICSFFVLISFFISLCDVEREKILIYLLFKYELSYHESEYPNRYIFLAISSISTLILSTF